MRTILVASLSFAWIAFSGASAYADPLVPNLIAYWDFDHTEGLELPAVVGGYDGDLVGTWPADDSQWVESTLGLGHALNFKGGWVDMGTQDPSNPLNVSGDLTIAAWIKPDSMGGNGTGRIFNHRTSSSGQGGYELYMRGGGQLAVHGVAGTGSWRSTPDGAIQYGSAAPWQHVAITMSEVYQSGGNDRTDLTFYVDGKQVHTTSAAPPQVVSAADPTLLLGYSTTHSPRQFDGQMDDVGVWGQALEPAHIATLHSVVHHGEMNYDLSQAQQLFEVHAAGEGSTTLNGRQWDYATGLSTDPADLGRVVVADGRYTVALDSSGAGVSAPSNLVAYWNFNETSGTTLPDVLGNYHGTLEGSWPGDDSQWVAGKEGLGNALDFKGGWVDMGEVPQDNPMNTDGSLTIAAWIKPDSMGYGTTTGRILNHRSGSQNSGYEVYLRDNGRIALHYGPETYTNSPRVVEVGPDAPWQHVAVTLSEVYQVQVGEDWEDRTDLTFYLNGDAVSSHVITPPVPVPGEPTLLLGDSTTHGTPRPGGRSFDGRMDDVGVWSTPLGAPQLRALYTLADHADIRHDLGQVQALLDVYDAGIGGGVRHGSLQWDAAIGIETRGAELGEVFKADGRYVVALDDEGTGFAANAALIAHWAFDEASGDVAYDSAGTNHGTLTGSTLPERIDGKFGNALRFTGTDDQHVEVGADNVITALSGPKTFSFWTRMLGTDTYSNGFLGIDDNTSGNRWYIDDFRSQGGVRVWQVGGGENGELFRVEDVLDLNSPEWQHVLVADDGTGPGGTRIYVDGQQAGTAQSFDYSGLLPGSVLRLGAARHSGNYEYLQGDLDDVGVWRVALSDPQAKALYNVAQHPELGYDLGQTQRLFNAHDEIGGARADGRYWVHTTGLSTDPDDLGQVVQDGRKFYLPLAGDGTGVWAPGKLLAHWTFDDGQGTTVTDSTGNLDGTLQGSDVESTWIADGKFGGALRLNRDLGQFVEAGSQNLVTSLLGEKTIAFWTRLPEEGAGSSGFISIGKDSNNRWYIDDENRGSRIRMWQVGGGAEQDDRQFRTSTGVLTYGEEIWHHVVLADDGSATRVYVDGDLKGTYGSFDYFELPSDSVLRLGTRFTSSIDSMDGDLDDFGIWSVALTDPQVLGLHQFGMDPALGYDLGQVQQLYDLHELGPGGGELVLDGVWHWQYSDGLDFDLGVLNREGGHYFIQLDAAGTGLMAIPEPGTFAMLALALIGLLPARRRNRKVSSP